jgi:hypothetical protein
LKESLIVFKLVFMREDSSSILGIAGAASAAALTANRSQLRHHISQKSCAGGSGT